MDRAIEKFYQYLEEKKDALRKAKQKSFYERAKPYVEISVCIIATICVALAVYYFFYYKINR